MTDETPDAASGGATGPAAAAREGYFESMPAARRRAMTEAARREGVTLTARWAELLTEVKDGWRPRAALAAEMLAATGSRSVLDLGCGHMHLEALLPEGVRYIPSDVVSRDDRTLVCDLNLEPPPQVEADAVAGLGLLEYIFDPAKLLGCLARQHRFAVLSYHPLSPARSLARRRAVFWFSDLSAEALRAVFTGTGWAIREEREAGPEQFIWCLERRAAPGC